MGKMSDILSLEEEVISVIENYIVNDLGGTVYSIDLHKQTIDMEVDEKLEEKALDLIEKILAAYLYDLYQIKQQNPFASLIIMMIELDKFEQPEE